MERGTFEQPSASRTPKRSRERERELANHDKPKEAFSVEFRFKFLADRRLNVEENEGASDIEEKTSHGKVLSWTDPERKTASRISVQCGRNQTAGKGTTRHLLPTPNNVSSGSMTDKSSFPSFRNRSGLNLLGSE